MKRMFATVAVCAAAALSLTAFSSDSDSSPRDEATAAASELCTGLSELMADSAELAALDPDSATEDRVTSAYEAVRADRVDGSKALDKIDSAKRSALQSASDDLRSPYEGLPGDTTGTDAPDMLKPQIQQLDETVAATSLGVRCP